MDRDRKEIIRILKIAVALTLVFLGLMAVSATCYLVVSTLRLLAG